MTSTNPSKFTYAKRNKSLKEDSPLDALDSIQDSPKKEIMAEDKSQVEIMWDGKIFDQLRK